MWNTPNDIPTGSKFVIELTTAITSGESIFIDDMCLFLMSQFGDTISGPYINLVTGSTAHTRGDKHVVTVTNDRAGTMQEHFDRLFGMYALGLQLPHDPTPTISESLIA